MNIELPITSNENPVQVIPSSSISTPININKKEIIASPQEAQNFNKKLPKGYAYVPIEEKKTKLTESFSKRTRKPHQNPEFISLPTTTTNVRNFYIYNYNYFFRVQKQKKKVIIESLNYQLFQIQFYQN